MVLFSHAKRRKFPPHLNWWTFGVFMYGVGTLMESMVALFGWDEFVFRMWYISGALLGGFPLAQGTVYLLLPRKTANILSAIYIPFILIAAACIWLTPLNYNAVEIMRLSGHVIVWKWVRFFSPFINIYALFFLVGGALLSAYRYKQLNDSYYRFLGNLYIAVGGLLPGIGGTFTRMGYVEVLYITELIGISLIYLGYLYNVKDYHTIGEKSKIVTVENRIK
jgi:hypothetical protein